MPIPKGRHAVQSHVSGSIWKIQVEPGMRIEAGMPLVVAESMKMEVVVEAPFEGTVLDVLCREGKPVTAGQPLVVMSAERGFRVMQTPFGLQLERLRRSTKIRRRPSGWSARCSNALPRARPKSGFTGASLDAVLAQLAKATKSGAARREIAAVRRAVRGEGQHRRRRFADDRGVPGVRVRSAEHTAAVERLVNAGAIVVGKTNLDQFATGLVGTRSPYGVCKNAFDERYLSGGSSSGSALAVAHGLVSFSLGTDTAGSGRVPAAFNNLVGVKPTRGLVSTRGVVPACRSLDCVSVFAGNCADALAVSETARPSTTPAEPYSRDGASLRPTQRSNPPRFGVLAPADREFFGDTDAARLYDEATARFAALGGKLVTIDYSPFRGVAELLYSGPWVAERLLVAGALLESNPDAIHPVVRTILEGAQKKTAIDAFDGAYRLAELCARPRPSGRRWTRARLAHDAHDVHDRGDRARSGREEFATRLLHELRQSPGPCRRRRARGVPRRRDATRRHAPRTRGHGLARSRRGARAFTRMRRVEGRQRPSERRSSATRRPAASR